jgi:hypothetical protein
LPQWTEAQPSIQAYHHALVSRFRQSTRTLLRYAMAQVDGLLDVYTATCDTMCASTYGMQMAAPLNQHVRVSELKAAVRALNNEYYATHGITPFTTILEDNDVKISAFMDATRRIYVKMRAFLFNRDEEEQSKYEAVALKKRDRGKYKDDDMWLQACLQAGNDLLELNGEDEVAEIQSHELDDYLPWMVEKMTRQERKEKVLDLASQFISHNFEIEKQRGTTSATDLRGFFNWLRSKTYGSRRASRTTGDSQRIRLVSSPWDLRLLNQLGLQNALSYLYANLIENNPQVMGMALLAAQSSPLQINHVGTHGEYDYPPVAYNPTAAYGAVAYATDYDALLQRSRENDVLHICTVDLDTGKSADEVARAELARIRQSVNSSIDDHRARTARQAEESKSSYEGFIRETEARRLDVERQARDTATFFDQQRADLAAQSLVWQKQMSNATKEMDSGKVKSAEAFTVEEEESTRPMLAAAVGNPTRASHERYGPPDSARGRGPTAGEVRMPGIRPRPPRRDASGKVVKRLTDKPKTSFGSIPPRIQAPYLASMGITEGNWETKGGDPCGLCGVNGEADHAWWHCIYLWACTPEGRKFLGDAKAMEKVRDLYATANKTLTIHELQESIMDERDERTAEAFVGIVNLMDYRGEDPALDFAAHVVDASCFAADCDQLA